jgi:hypothetical protein
MRRNHLVSIALCALSFGCAPSNPGLSIDGVLIPSDNCEYSANSAFLVESVLDTNPDIPRAGGIRYVAVLRVANRLINNGNRIYPLMADPNSINIESAEVEVLNTDGTPFAFGDGLPNPFRVSATGSIPSTTSNEPQLGISVAEILPPQYGAALAGIEGSLVFSIRVIGVTTGGAALTSGRVVLPLRLCSGCLFGCVLDEMGDPIEVPSCSPGQDAFTQTCL